MCRCSESAGGVQVANVVLGGTLIQDVAVQFSQEIEHSQNTAEFRASQPSHDVQVEPGSTLDSIYESRVVRVNSYHHRAIRDLSPELRVASGAPDGVIEAVDRPSGAGWFLGVQWHPEMMFRERREQLRPFEALVSAARRKHSETPAA